ncbi:biotin/lipoyl-binding protein [Vibrio sp. SS-MA-C1-2]|uniref:HlyD family secretion protein n=1 Tax=Vibrio sp. SS-MA-C1-2 TaxID=2908646 RepID=UPI001F1D7A8D|nr:biotin/lipoyl-binding protein [Vibrio sp. SS-MA-C1-2]UJF17559.1 biotin/lipoyl-binding protein [Vibrio sp. SS-MA-C1-2]
MKSSNNKLIPAAIIAVIAVLVIWLGYQFWLAYQPQPTRIQGQIEAQQYSISSKIPGRIEDVLVKKGDEVKQDQLIFTLNSPEVAAKLQQAKAGQQAAGALAQEANNGARVQQISAAEDQWQKAKAAAALWDKTYKRISNLYNDGVVAEQKSDEAYTQWQAAKYTEQAAYQMYQMAKEGARQETKVAAQGKANMAAGAVAEVEAYVAETKIMSHYNGEVSQVLLHAGELAPQGFPVVTVIDMGRAWAVFHIREDNLKNFNKGMTFSAKIPALGEKSHQFTVRHVAVMGDFATWRATDTRKGFDMRTFQIEADPVQPIAGLRVGMSVLVD